MSTPQSSENETPMATPAPPAALSFTLDPNELANLRVFLNQTEEACLADASNLLAHFRNLANRMVDDTNRFSHDLLVNTISELQTQLNTTNHMLADQTAANSTLRQKYTRRKESMQVLENRITTLTLQMDNLNHALGQIRPNNTASAATPKIEKIPDPPKYSGGREELTPFLAQLRLKIHSNPDGYPTVQHKLAYLYSRLEGAALKQLMPLLQDDDTIAFGSLKEATDMLVQCYGDPDEKGTALHLLENLRQTNRDFSTYFAEFQRLMGILDYSEEAKLHMLKRGLSNEIKEKLVGVADEPTNFDGFVTLVKRLDNKIRAYAQETNRRTNRNSTNHIQPRTTTSSSRAAAPVAQAVAPRLPPATVQPSAIMNPQYLGPAPMDLSSGRRKLTVEEKAQRLAEGRCLYCGGFGHMAGTCPVKPANRRPVQAAALVSGGLPAPPSSDLLESGNDHSLA